MIDQDKLSTVYRQYREKCGVKDPVMLDEIEEAYLQGMQKQQELMVKEGVLADIFEKGDGTLKMLSFNSIEYQNYLLSNFKNGDRVKIVLIKV